MIDARKFGPDSSRAHHDEGLWHALQFEDVIGIYDRLAVGLKAGDGPNDGAGGDDDVLCLKRLCVAVGERDLDLAWPEDLGEAVIDRHLVLFHQIGHARLFLATTSDLYFCTPGQS